MILKFSEEFDHTFCMFLYLVTCLHMFQFIPIYLVKADEIVQPCDRRSNEIATIRKHVAKYSHM